ncbi:MAG: preprotein translocase subunit SecG [Endomicrobium sp.]|nr:preprotein translocase subunit SecG [Endomicrobium sp.]
MINILKIAHYIICFLLIFLILLQSGVNVGLTNIFGSGSQQIFNVPTRTSFIKKVTAVISCIFMLNAFLMTKYLT